nr:unnamed protein product [Digitaria exilis]
MERASEWNAGRDGEAAKVGVSEEAITAESRGSATWRWRSAAAISPGEERAGSTGGRGAGAGGGTAAAARGLAGGVLTILRERKEILVERSSVADGGGTVAGDRERAGRPIKVSQGELAAAKYGAAGVGAWNAVVFVEVVMDLGGGGRRWERGTASMKLIDAT